MQPQASRLHWFVCAFRRTYRNINPRFTDLVRMDIAGPTSVVFECVCIEIPGGVCDQHYADSMDELRRNSGFDCRVGRGRKKHS
jgi:hypothetical protein